MRIIHVLLLLFIGLMCAFAFPPKGDDDFLGRWDLTVTPAEGRPFPSWLEVTRENGGLKARYVGRGGSVFPVPDVNIENGELKFQYKQGRTQQVTIANTARLKNGRLEGTTTMGDRAPVSWTGVRAPKWPAKAPKRKADRPVELFNGKDLAGWLPQIPDRPLGWMVTDGAMSNGGKANNIYSDKKFSDFKLNVEFTVGPKSNSGIYLRGRYEIQVLDDFGMDPESHRNGALYGFLTPKVNASKRADEWQTVEATIIANRVSIVLNGTSIIEDQEIPGITGGALDSHEAEPGPIMLQGDHGPVKFRKVTVTPLR